MAEKIEKEKKKRSLAKRVCLWISIFLLAIITLWGVVLAFVTNPSFLTPRVVEIAQQSVRSEFSLKNIDVSLFRRFPYVTMRIDSLRITQTKDSIDDLLFARECNVAVNPFSLLFKKLSIKDFALRDAKVYIYVDSLHGPLKTFILPEEQPDTLANESMDLSDYRFELKRMVVDSLQVVIDDRRSRFYTRIENFHSNMSMTLSSHLSDIDLTTGFGNMIVWRDGDILVKKTTAEVESKMVMDQDSMTLDIHKADIKINGITFTSSGRLKRDTVSKNLLVNATSSLATPSLNEFLKLVPSALFASKDAITTEGSVDLKLDVNGEYGENIMPMFTAALKVYDAKAKYASRRLALEHVDCDALFYVDPNTLSNSYAQINRLYLNTSNIITLAVNGKVSNMINSPYLNLAINSNLNFDRFSELFPMNDGLICSGQNVSNIKTSFAMNDLTAGRYANLYLDGESTFKNLEVKFDGSKFDQEDISTAYLYMKAKEGKMLFGDRTFASNASRTLRSTMNFSGINYYAQSGEYINISDIELSMGANFDRATSAVNGLGARGVAQNTKVGIANLFGANLESSDILLTFEPESDKHKRIINLKVESKKVDAQDPVFNSTMSLSSANMNFVLREQAIKNWNVVGDVAFTDFGMYTDLFPLQISIPDSSVSVAEKTVKLKDTHIKIGESEMVATGYIHNILHKLFADPKAKLSGELAIKSPNLNITELIEASNKSYMLMEEMYPTPEPAADSVVMAQAADSVALDSVPSALFLVPRKVDFVFDLNVDKAQFADAMIENVEGRATIRKRALSLDKLKLNAIGADATGSMVYKNINRGQGANVRMNMDLAGVDINRIGELIPSINTMFPILESFEGIADFSMKANVNMLNTMDIDFTTLQSAMRFKGKDLVLMDSETFKYVSKMLMFKNKKRNLIDSLEAYALVNGTFVEVLPFSMVMDRYAAVIGGTQTINPETFDVDYKYNVSVTKSPLPFKAGVDITGDLEDFKFRITKAKLKNTNFTEQRKKYEQYRNEIE